MIPALNIWDLLMVVGIAQGMVLAFVLWFRRNNHISAKFLGVIFFTLAFSLLGTLISEKEPEPVTSFYLWLMRYVPFWPFMLIGPSLLFMIQSQADRNFSFGRKRKTHFVAALYHLIPTIAWITAWIRFKLDLVQYNKPKFLEFIYVFYTQGDIVYWVHLLIYLFLSTHYLRKNQVKNEEKFYQIITAFKLFLIAWFPFLVLYVSPFNEVLDPLSYYPVCIPVTVLIYWLGFQWFFHLERSKNAAAKSNLDFEKTSMVLNKGMKEGLYLDHDLSLKSAAQKLEIPQRALSQYLNQYLNKSFNDYINYYRIQEVKRKLSDTKLDHLTIAAIAHDSGFKSVATFQRAFKRMEGVSPLQFKNQSKKVLISRFD